MAAFEYEAIDANGKTRKGLIEMTDLKLYVSDSVLTGTMKADATGPVPKARQR